MKEKKEISNYVGEARQKNGNKIWITLNFKGIFDDNGNLKYIDGVAQNITEKVKKNQELTKLYSAIEQSSSIITITDLKGNIEYANQRFYQITGYTPMETIGKNPRILKSGHLDSNVYQDLWATISQGEEWTGQFQNRKKNGVLYWEYVSITPIFDNAGNIINYLKVADDITKLIELEEEKQKLSKQHSVSQKLETVGTLAGGIAHDFNNILTPIIGYSSRLKKFVNDELVLDGLNEIYDAGIRAKELTAQILNFSRNSEIEKKSMMLTPILKEVIKLLKHTAPAWIDIDLKISGRLPKVLIDGTKFHQVIMNLCTNSIHAIDDTPGAITITLDKSEIENEPYLIINGVESGSYVKLTISDTGAGIPEEILDRIFDPFYTTKEEGKGTGLGLSVVHGIIKEHDGFIFVESEIGKGTKFTIYLPVPDEKSASSEFLSKDNEKIYEGKETILFVDDRTDVRKLTKEILSDFGYHVLDFGNPIEALEYYKIYWESISIVLTDYSMPKMNGVDFANNVWQCNPDIQIIIITGNVAEIDKSKIEQPEKLRIVPKPILIPDISKIIRDELDKVGETK